jgi:arabinogalactan endo-1,4-beta-galactosidase
MNPMNKHLIILIILASIGSSSSHAFDMVAQHQTTFSSSDDDTMLGIDANYVTTMQDFFFRWRYHFIPIDVYPFFHEKGINYFRLRVFVKDNGSDGLPYAINTAKLVQQQGMNCTVTLFMSSDWSDIGKQPAPEEWNTLYDYRNLPLEHKADVIRNYTKNTTQQLLANDIDANLYEIGN